MATLRAAQILKSCVEFMKPKLQEKDGINGIMGNIKKIYKGPSGYELISFPLMRVQLVSTFNGERFTINGADNNKIDGIVVKPSLKDRQMAGSCSPDYVSSPVGTVLFCCPNAGMYECMANASRDVSWIGYYTRLGFDVCIFNYRGFAASTGYPTPSSLKKDTEVVVRYLRETRQVQKLVLHGESIGGMMACHAANICGADLLICDRTFCSLDAVAERLMGSWASYGLQIICRWNTDVVADFLQTRCPRIVLQDPADEIISHCSSLKCGVATSIALKDSSWGRVDLSWKYISSELKQSDQVPSYVNMNPESSDSMGFISEGFVEHFSACIINIGRRANSIANCRLKSGLSGEHKPDRNGDKDSISAQQSTVKSDYDLEAGERDEPQLLVGSDGIEADGLAYMGVNSGNVKMDRAAKMVWLEKFCSQNIGPGNTQLHPLERIWIALARTNGSCGQLLGQAVSTKNCHDSLRSWLCCLLVWSPFAQNDRTLPSRSSSLSHCVIELEELVLR